MMMAQRRNIALTALVAGIAAMTFASVAEARPDCRARTGGLATGQGLFGMGTANARSAAVSDWAEKVNARWGIYYANFDNARGVRWNCRKGAILQARCSVSAVPCRP